MHSFYLDIESIPLPVEAREFMRPSQTSVKMGNTKDLAKREAKIAEAIRDFESGADAALDEFQAQIAVIGWVLNHEPYRTITLENQTEREMLSSFWSCVNSLGTDCELIGWNIRGFDGPMLVKRSWINGLTPPNYLVADLCSYNPRQWKDPMLLWQLGDRRSDYRSLKNVCASFGLKVKEGEINGANFFEWWEKDKSACVEYNRADVEAVCEVWRRIGH